MLVELLTSADADSLARRAAASLRQRGCRTGDRIAVVLPAPGDHGSDTARRRAATEQRGVLGLVAGALRSGVVPVMVNPALTPGERQLILDDADPTLVVDDPATLAALLDGDPVADLNEVPLARPMHYTSGTTGRPKGVWSGVLEVTDAEALWADEADLWALDADDILLTHGPLAHSAPLRFALATLWRGGSVLLPGWFDATAIAQAIVEHRPTVAFTVPSHLQRLFALPQVPASTYRLLAHAGSSCPPTLKRAIHAWAGVERTWEFYGSTEGQFTVCSGPEWQERPGTVGRARPGRSLRVVDADADGIGTIRCAPPSWGAFEYWRDPAKTTRAWSLDPQGRREFTVGDLGRLDSEGYLWLDGRRDDLVITGGVNVYPDEVEAVLAACPGVEQIAVFGRDDEHWGQRVCAAYVGSASSEVVAQWAREQLAGYKRPKEYHRVSELPHTETGKVRRLSLPDILP